MAQSAKRIREVGGQKSEVSRQRTEDRIANCGFGKAWSIGQFEIWDFGLRISNLESRNYCLTI